jgi:hypothetical protein
VADAPGCPRNYRHAACQIQLIHTHPAQSVILEVLTRKTSTI